MMSMPLEYVVHVAYPIKYGKNSCSTNSPSFFLNFMTEKTAIDAKSIDEILFTFSRPDFLNPVQYIILGVGG